MNMLVHKLVFFCWLVSTCFGENTTTGATTITTPTTESSTSATTVLTTTQSSTTGSSGTTTISTTPTTESSTTATTATTATTVLTTTQSPTTESSGTTTISTTPTTESSTTATTATTATTVLTTTQSPTTGSSGTTTISTTPTTESSTTATTATTVLTTTQSPTTGSSGTTTISTTPTTESSTTATTATTATTVLTTTQSPTTGSSGTTTISTTPTTESSTTATTATTVLTTTQSPTIGPSGTTTISTTPTTESSTTATTVLTTTQSPTIGSSATGSPEINSTSPPPMTSPTPGSNATSIHPNETEPSTTATTVPPTTKPSACTLNPCPFGSTCIELFNGSTCQCFPGSFFSGDSCVTAKVFPVDLRFTTVFQQGMENSESEIFQKTAENITAALREALSSDPTYIESKVLELRKGSVVATVDNIYNAKSDATEKSFLTALNEAIDCTDNCGILGMANLTVLKPCEQNSGPCDEDTTTCDSLDGIVSCTCKSGYIKSKFTERICSACPSGMEQVNNICSRCSFGYSGFNCNDSSLLAVVVISCVLGGLMLITLLAFVLYYCRTNKKGSDYNSPYPPAQETRTTWSSSQVPKIPRANTNLNANWDPIQFGDDGERQHAGPGGQRAPWKRSGGPLRSQQRRPEVLLRQKPVALLLSGPRPGQPTLHLQ
ncbi:hypothetical protein SKAU_G00132980 [Synaphobranchus kaupii]|uniref:Uncharacterized protein n=1 Tax=Synaphobranchus kaupii TaxID=118154 RepID=A0A9Q1FRS3_SYNKA|nr:hypothetical protein SKAU_G00132980 [Synaphobranchus kaupii]